MVESRVCMFQDSNNGVVYCEKPIIMRDGVIHTVRIHERIIRAVYEIDDIADSLANAGFPTLTTK